MRDNSNILHFDFSFMSLKILFIGDIVGKLGRKGVVEIVPKLKKERGYDLIIANIENLAHGKGITKETLNSIKEAGIDVYTSGNHVWDKEEGVALLESEEYKILRPANYPEGAPGRGVFGGTGKGGKEG